MEDNQRILIIDDDPGVRDAFREILAPSPTYGGIAERGAALFGEAAPDVPSCVLRTYDLSMADSGEAGITAVTQSLERQAPYAVAFIDMNMPGINGAETSRRVWAVDPNIKIVIVTAFSEHRPCDIIDIARRDDIFYLRKPFNSEEIRQFANALTHAWKAERERDDLSARLEARNAELEAVNGALEKKVREYRASITKILQQCRALEETAVFRAGDGVQAGIEEILRCKARDESGRPEEMIRLAGDVMEGIRRVRDVVKELRSLFSVAGPLE